MITISPAHMSRPTPLMSQLLSQKLAVHRQVEGGELGKSVKQACLTKQLQHVKEIHNRQSSRSTAVGLVMVHMACQPWLMHATQAHCKQKQKLRASEMQKASHHSQQQLHRLKSCALSAGSPYT